VRLLAREAFGSGVIVAGDAVTTVALALACTPELVVVDMMSVQAKAALAADLRTANTPTLAIVGDPNEQEIVGRSDDFILYPFDAAELAARVRGVVRRADVLRSTNPLTGLPANGLIADELERRTAARQRFACLHVDVDDFKALNDREGFTAGDHVIRVLAGCITDVLATAGWPGSYVGHVGGDDFVVLVPGSRGREAAAAIIAAFDIAATGCSISIGVVDDGEAGPTAADVARLVAEAKAEAKRAHGSAAASPPRRVGAIVTVEL
jgi:diguanylate cyclase (GGDEF)-like protein